MWGFNTLVTCGWGQQSGNGDKLMVPFSDIPNHRRQVSSLPLCTRSQEAAEGNVARAAGSKGGGMGHLLRWRGPF